METKQIIPNKSLFGESKLAANVIIQLSTVPARIRALSRRNQNSRLKNQSNKLSDVTQDALDNVIATPSFNDIALSISDVNSKSIDNNYVQRKTANQSDGEIQSDGGSEDKSEGESEGEKTGNDFTTL